MKVDQFPDYLGDGVYVSFDGYNIWLRTQQGTEIALEPAVFRALVRYQARLADAIKERNT